RWADIPGASVTNNRNVHVEFTFTRPVVTEKVRFYSEATDDGFIRVREIIVYGLHTDVVAMMSDASSSPAKEVPARNVAQGKPVTASSHFATRSSLYPPEKAVDGNYERASRWLTENGALPP